MLKNLKMSRRITLIIIILLIIGLAGICTVTDMEMGSAMRQTTEDRLGEAVDARIEVVDTYLSDACQYFECFSKSEVVKNVLENPNDPAAFQKAESYLKTYAATRPELEGMFICDPQTYMVCYTNEAIIGKQIKTSPEDIQAVQNDVTSARGGVVRGIAKSTATGKIVTAIYCGVFDDAGNLTGCVGGGIFMTELTARLNQMSFNGISNTEFYLLGNKAGNYLMAPDESMVGADVTDSAHAHILDSVKELNVSDDIASESYQYTADNGQKMMAVYGEVPGRNMTVIVQDNESDIFAAVDKLTRILIILCIVVLIVLAGATALAVQKIANDLTKVGRIIEEIGSLDITQADKLEEYTDRRDEIGGIARATTNLAAALRKAINQLKEHSEELKEGSARLLQNSNSTLMSVEQIDQAVQQIAQGAVSQSNETQKASGSVYEMGELVGTTMKQTQALQSSAELMRTSSDSARKTFGELHKINEQARNAIDVIYEQTNNTNASVVKIQAATEMISSFAEETNLLSLNASIEAARAGEAGKGFAVVATQIQKLADQSNNSTKQIEEILNILIRESNTAVRTMDEVKSIIRQQSDFVHKTEALFGNVEEGIDASLEGISKIIVQSRKMDDARTAVVGVVQSLAAISEENAASTEETSASTDTVNDMMVSIADSASRMAGIAAGIEESVEVFRI